MHYFHCSVILILETFFINIATSTIFINPEVKQIVEFYGANDDFSKYWPLFDQFLPCTIHFSRTPDGWLDMHNSFLERCRYLGYCTALQTSNFEPGCKYSSRLLEAWNRTDFKDVLSILGSIFQPHKFHQVCTVQLNLSHFDLIDNTGDPWLFSAISPHKSYFILPVEFEINSKSQFLRYLNSPFLDTSKFISLNRNITAAYMACLTCNTEDYFAGIINQFFTMIANPLIKLDISSISLSELDSIWHFYHSNKNNLNTKLDAVKKCANAYYDEACVYGCLNGKPLLESELKCSTHLVENFFNMTGLSPKQGFFAKRESFTTTLSPAGAQFNGIRYSMFVKPTYHKSTVDSMIALLSPFSYIDWAFVITCIFLLASALQLTGFPMQHALFWIIASIVEQGSYRKDYVSNRNKHIIISWLFTALLFRNLYTTDLYSNLTRKPIAKDLPKCFKELVLNYTFPTLSFRIVTYYYVNKLTNNRKNFVGKEDYFRTIFHRFNKRAYWLEDIRKPNNLVKFITGQRGIKANKGMMDGRPYYTDVFPTWDRFALLYEVKNDMPMSAPYMKPFFQAYGGLDLYRNNEVPVLVSPILWYFHSNHFFSKTFFTGIANLQESGISNYYDSNRIVMHQLDFLERYGFKRECGNMTSLNLFGLARMATSEGLKLRGEEILGCQRYIVQRSAKIGDFVAVWVILGWVLGFASVCFTFEILRNKWGIYCTSKIISAWNNFRLFMLKTRIQFRAVFRAIKSLINTRKVRSNKNECNRK